MPSPAPPWLDAEAATPSLLLLSLLLLLELLVLAWPPDAFVAAACPPLLPAPDAEPLPPDCAAAPAPLPPPFPPPLPPALAAAVAAAACACACACAFIAAACEAAACFFTSAGGENRSPELMLLVMVGATICASGASAGDSIPKYCCTMFMVP